MGKVRNGFVLLDGAKMDYAVFGSGREALLMLPGLGDGLTTVKGKALWLSLLYRCYAKDYRVYIFSREVPLREGTSTREMAGTLAQAMRALGISRAKVLGISQGGMIAQYLAIDAPELVEKLVLAVTLPGPNACVRQAVGRWIELAEQGDYKGLMTDTAERSYSERWLKRYRPFYPLLGRVGRPKDFRRFFIQAASCLRHDARAELGRIACPTLVLGGEEDRVVGAAASVELAAAIRGSELYLYKGLGHGAYEEAPDFPARVLHFLRQPHQ